MLRLPTFHLVPALLAAGVLTAQAQAPVDSVVRTTTVTTVTTTTVTKPAAPGSKPTAPVTTSSSTTTTSATPAPAATTPAPPAAPARPPAPGDLTGARPKPSVVPAASTASSATAAKPAPTAKPKASTAPTAAASRPAAATTTARPAATPARRTTPADPELTRLLQTDVDLTKVKADQLPDLYERFMETTRAERRQWNAAQWASASAVLARLNQRYEQVRGELSLEEKLNIRTLQGEFRGLEAAKQVSKRL